MNLSSFNLKGLSAYKPKLRLFILQTFRWKQIAMGIGIKAIINFYEFYKDRK